MSSREYDQRVLDAIENQLRTEEPQLVDYFSAFGIGTPLIKPVNGWGRAAPSHRVARRGTHWLTNRRGYEIVLWLVPVFVAIILVAVLITGGSG